MIAVEIYIHILLVINIRKTWGTAPLPIFTNKINRYYIYTIVILNEYKYSLFVLFHIWL